jgi:hypothetical protein
MGSGIIEIWEAHRGRGIFLAHPNPIQLMNKRRPIHRKLFIVQIITFQRACVLKKDYAIFGFIHGMHLFGTKSPHPPLSPKVGRGMG